MTLSTFLLSYLIYQANPIIMSSPLLAIASPDLSGRANLIGSPPRLLRRPDESGLLAMTEGEENLAMIKNGANKLGDYI
jgi:hypothetical protein